MSAANRKVAPASSTGASAVGRKAAGGAAPDSSASVEAKAVGRGTAAAAALPDFQVRLRCDDCGRTVSPPRDAVLQFSAPCGCTNQVRIAHENLASESVLMTANNPGRATVELGNRRAPAGAKTIRMPLSRYNQLQTQFKTRGTLDPSSS